MRVYIKRLPRNAAHLCRSLRRFTGITFHRIWNFRVEITETTANRRLSERQRIKQNFDVQYFPGDESENRRKECEKVKQKMLRRFDVISADGLSFYVRNKNASIVDDVLHLMFYVTYTEYEEKEIPKMEEMNTNIETEEKDGRNMGKPE